MGVRFLALWLLALSGSHAGTLPRARPTKPSFLFLDIAPGSGDNDELPELTSATPSSRISTDISSEILEVRTTTSDIATTSSVSVDVSQSMLPYTENLSLTPEIASTTTWPYSESPMTSEDAVSTSITPYLEITSEAIVVTTEEPSTVTPSTTTSTTTSETAPEFDSSTRPPTSTTFGPPERRDCICNRNITVKLQPNRAVTNKSGVFTLGEGRNLTLQCHLDGEVVSNGTVSWEKINNSLSELGNEPSLDLLQARMEDAGLYTCSVDCCVSEPLQLLVYPDPNYALQIYVLGAAFAILVLLAVILTALRSYLVRRQHLTHFKEVTKKERTTDTS